MLSFLGSRDKIRLQMKDHVFITGFWNSGTTVLARLLSRHPDIKIKMSRGNPNYEETFIEDSLQKIGLHLPHFELEKVTKYGLEPYTLASPQRAGEFAGYLRSHLGGKRRLLKNCRLFFCKELLDNAFPKAKRIMILRDGGCQVISKGYWKKNADGGKDKLRNRAKLWDICMEYHFTVWHKDPNTMTVRYEDLCNDTRSVMEEVCDFLLLDYKKLHHRLPLSLKNMNYKWNDFDGGLRQIVEEQITPSLKKLNELCPVKYSPKPKTDESLTFVDQTYLTCYELAEKIVRKLGW